MIATPTAAAATAAERIARVLPEGPVDRHSSTATVVRFALGEQARLLAVVAPRLTGGQPSSEDVHDARLALRAARSHLRTFAPILDRQRSAALAATLAPLADSLGPLRELDVLVDVVEGYEQELPEDADALSALRLHLAAQRPKILAELVAALGTASAADALDALIDFAADLPIVDRADERAAIVLTDLAQRSWRKLMRIAARLDERSSSAELHELRIATKRARHAMRVARIVRPAAGTHVAALGRLAQTLGDLNDATIVTARLGAAVAPDLDTPAAYAAGLVVAGERQRMAATRATWPRQWQQARRKRVRAWLEDPG